MRKRRVSLFFRPYMQRKQALQLYDGDTARGRSTSDYSLMATRSGHSAISPYETPPMAIKEIKVFRAFSESFESVGDFKVEVF